MIIFADHYTLSYGLATDDIDFAVENIIKLPEKRTDTIPEVLERLGYTPLHDYSGIETYIHGTFEVEFITHRRGGNAPPSVIIPPWKVSAQPLPFIDLLFIRPVTVTIQNFSIRIPSPETLVIHKLIIAQRRTGRDKVLKKEKDLQQCSALGEALRSEEVTRILLEYRMSKEVKKSMRLSMNEAEISLPGWT